MRSIDSWLAEYGESHHNPINKRLHWICVPLIMLALVLLFSAIPTPAAFAPSPWMHWGTALLIAALLYYFVLAPRLALGMIPVSAALVFATWGIGLLPWPVAISGAVIFVASWIGQFIGHHYEGRRPAFLKDLQFLMIGPLWLLSWIYARFGWRIA